MVLEEIDIFPLGGVSNAITVFCKEGEDFSIYKSDRYGFNNPDQEWDNEKVLWFLIGDSFAQGACVQPGDDFASRIRLLTKRSAINLGMAGNGPLIELASLKEYILEKRPKIVLWFYFERNDLEDLRNEKSNSILMKYLNEDFTQNLHSKQSEINKKLKMYIKLAEREFQKEIFEIKKDADRFLTLKKIIRLQILRDKIALDRGLDFGIDPLFEKILIEAKNFVNKWDGKLYFVYLPDKERYSNKKKSCRLKFFDLIDPQISFDFLLGMYLLLFKRKKWEENVDVVDEKLISDIRTFATFDNTCAYVKIISKAFSNSKAYYQADPLSINLKGKREWSNFYNFIEIIRIPEVLDVHKSNGLSGVKFFYCKNYALRNFIPNFVKMFIKRDVSGFQYINLNL